MTTSATCTKDLSKGSNLSVENEAQVMEKDQFQYDQEQKLCANTI